MSADTLVPPIRRSPNIWDNPEIYEIENRACDRAGVIEAAMDELHPLRGSRLVDIGCGTGFHLPRWHARGAEVVGVEPHPPLVALARERLTEEGLAGAVQVLEAGAEQLPLPDASADVVHARWAYFFGAGCEPGLAEVERVLRPGGTAMIVDNDATRSTFGRWFTAAYPAYDPYAVARFWRRRGFTPLPLTVWWTHDSRADLEAVLRIELPPETADRVLAEHEGASVDYAVTLWHRTW